jgi:hypothetical protein
MKLNFLEGTSKIRGDKDLIIQKNMDIKSGLKRNYYQGIVKYF